MTRHSLALVAASVLLAAAMPAAAQDAPPAPVPHPAAPAWADPQAPHYPASPAGPDYAGAPFARPLPPGAYPGGPAPYPDYSEPLPPLPWHGEAGPGYGYHGEYGYLPAPCGCAGYGYPVMWVRVPIETRYSYSEPVRHEKTIVEERTVHETVPARRTKYVPPPATKMTKGKIVRSAK